MPTLALLPSVPASSLDYVLSTDYDLVLQVIFFSSLYCSKFNFLARTYLFGLYAFSAEISAFDDLDWYGS